MSTHDSRPWPRYPRVMQIVFDRPWAILPATLDAICEVIAIRASGERLTPEQIEARIDAGPGRGQQMQAGAVAVLPLYGVIVPRSTLMTDVSGGTSLQGFSQALAQCCADPSVGQILIDVNSPGGSVDMVPEVAAQIRAACQTKPVVAVANTMAASAAYWLASQADELVVTPSGSVGSVGVYLAHHDVSAAMEAEGVKTTLISAGKYKTEGNQFEPLSDDAQDAMQDMVDDFYEMFAGDVAKGRGVTPAAVKSGFGEGRMVLGKRAVAAGMADRVDTFDNTLARMMRPTGSRSRARALEDDADVQAIEPPTLDPELLAQIQADVDEIHKSLQGGSNE